MAIAIRLFVFLMRCSGVEECRSFGSAQDDDLADV